MPHLPQLGLLPPNCLPGDIGETGGAIRPPSAAPYRVPVGVDPSDSATRPLSIGGFAAGVAGADGAVEGFFSGLGARCGPAMVDSRGTVRGRPFGPRPACAGFAATAGGSQSSSSCAASLLSLSGAGDSAGSFGGEGVFEDPLNDVRFGLHEWVGLNIGAGELVPAPL